MLQQAQDNTLNHFHGLNTPADFWAHFQMGILAHSNNLKELELYATNAMPALHQFLSAQNEYQEKMAKIQHAKIEATSLSYLLFENDNFRVNLNAMEPDSSLPLHNHPGSAGLIFIVKGEANIVSCNSAMSAQRAGVTQTIIDVTENKTFSSNQFSCFTKDENNIHSINAIAGRCIMLVVHSNANMTNKQSYFFTENPEKTIGLQLLTQQVRAETLKKFNSKRLQKIQGQYNET